jgi:hypothetical protein
MIRFIINLLGSTLLFILFIYIVFADAFGFFSASSKFVGENTPISGGWVFDGPFIIALVSYIAYNNGVYKKVKNSKKD